VIKKEAQLDYNVRLNPNDVIALFECKVKGIYGKKEDLERCGGPLKTIKEKFKIAENHCKNLKGCFYISLMEAIPSRKDSTNYYLLTKKCLGEKAFVLFNSRRIRENKINQTKRILNEASEITGEWERLQKIIKSL